MQPDHSKSQPMDDKLSRNRRGHVTWFTLNFKALNILQEWLKLNSSNFLHREAISNVTKRMTYLPLNGRGSSHMTVLNLKFCHLRKAGCRMFNCWATCDKRPYRRGGADSSTGQSYFWTVNVIPASQEQCSRREAVIVLVPLLIFCCMNHSSDSYWLTMDWTTHKIALFLRRSGPPSKSTQVTQATIQWHLDWFIHFCRAHERDQLTDRQTHIPTDRPCYSVAIDHSCVKLEKHFRKGLSCHLTETGCLDNDSMTSSVKVS